jgi:hypothetical protein
VEPLADTVPVAPLTVNDAVVTDAGSTDRSKVTVTLLAAGTPVAPLAGLTEATVSDCGPCSSGPVESLQPATARASSNVREREMGRMAQTP